MGLHVVNQQSQQNNNQNSSNDSLGVVSLDLNTVEHQAIVFPYASIQHMHSADTIVEPEPNELSSIEPAEELQTIQFPYSSTYSIHELDFSVSLFEYGDSIDFSQRLQQAPPKKFTQELQEKVFVIHYKQINETTNNWMFWLILGALVLFGWSRLFYKRQLDLLMSSILHYNFAVKSIRNSSENSQRFSNILQFIFSLNIALFSYQVFNFYSPLHITGFKALGIVSLIAIGFLLIYGIKDFFFKFLGFVCDDTSYSFEYLFNVHLYNRVLGLFMFPVIISLAFIQNDVIDHKLILYAGFLLIITFFIFRIIRGIQISIKANVSILYMFLYFCTLEILPIAVLVKIGTIVLNKF